MYLKCHLAPPNGSRSANGEEDEEDFEEDDMDDREKFEDQLTSVGVIGRKIPGHAFPLLCDLLKERSQQLEVQLASAGSHGNASKSLNHLFEDIHWLILIACSLLTDKCEGETPIIPHHVMQYSINQCSLLSQQNQSVHQDAVVRLFAAMVALCRVETQAAKSGLSALVSPQVASSLTYFLSRWLVSYLALDEKQYRQVSQSLLSSFGRDTQEVKAVTSVLLDKVLTNLHMFAAEPAVMADTAFMFELLLKKPVRAQMVTETAAFWSIYNGLVSELSPYCLVPLDKRRLLYKGLSMAGSTETIKARGHREFWTQLLDKPLSSFCTAVSSPEFSNTFEEGRTKEAVFNRLELLIGCIQGCAGDGGLSSTVFMCGLPSLRLSIQLLDLYHNHAEMVQAIITMYSELASCVLPFIDQSLSQEFYKICLDVVKVYAKHAAGKNWRAVDENDKLGEVEVIFALLCNVMSKDILDFGEEDTTVVTGTHVALLALTSVIPVMDTQLLKFPVIHKKYFELLRTIAELEPEKICCLDDQQLQPIFGSVQSELSSLGSSGNDVIPCLSFVNDVCSFVLKNRQQYPIGGFVSQSLSCLLEALLEMLLFKPVDIGTMESASITLYYLVCACQSKYEELCMQLLNHQSTTEHFGRLKKALQQLNPAASSYVVNRAARLAFRERFTTFFLEVRAFLTAS